MTDWWQHGYPGGPMVPAAGECVIGSRIGKNGYARVPSGRRGVYLYAHRVAWEKAHGPIPAGIHLHHACENKACVNVEHMELLTPKEHSARHGEPREVVLARRAAKDRLRYHSDSVYRAQKIARSVAYKRRKREEAR